MNNLTSKLDRINRIGNKEIELLYYNCRGPSSEECLYKIEMAFGKIEWDTVGISEARKQREGLVKRNNGNYFMFKGETMVTEAWGCT